MMTTPRALLIDNHSPGHYHVTSRCVRQSWLCGRIGTKSFEHRKSWVVDRLKLLGEAFAIEIYAYSIMSNHFHLELYSDPLAPNDWSDAKVVDRWLHSCPPRDSKGEIDKTRRENRRKAFLADPDQLAQLRRKLGSVSVFMKLLKQPIARRANLEDGCTGHFFEQRFYSGALLDDAAVITAMSYVDLNPINAKIAETLEESDHTSIQSRLQNTTEAAADHIKPIISGLSGASAVPISKQEYYRQLRSVVEKRSDASPPVAIRSLVKNLCTFRRPQRAYGGLAALINWVSVRGLQLRERPLA